MSSAGSASMPAPRAPAASVAAMAAANAPVVTANPGGTATPARASSPRDAALPPTVAASAASERVTTRLTGSVLQDPDRAAVAVDPDPVPGPDPLGRVAAADDG